MVDLEAMPESHITDVRYGCHNVRDNHPVFAFVDPGPLIGERIAAEIEPLEEELSQTTDARERRRLMREIQRRAAVVEESLRNPSICW